VQRSATPDRVLVMSRSAVRICSSSLLFTCKVQGNRSPRKDHQERVSSRLSQGIVRWQRKNATG
jgi:hypothetical protein